jgi:hypothetical protein
MFRKLILTVGATVAIVAAATAAAPTTASAGWHGHHGHGHGYHGWNRGFRVGFYAPTYVAGPNCYVVKRVVFTPYGKRWRRVTVCD